MISDKTLHKPTYDMLKQDGSCMGGQIQIPNWVKGLE